MPTYWLTFEGESAKQQLFVGGKQPWKFCPLCFDQDKHIFASQEISEKAFLWLERSSGSLQTNLVPGIDSEKAESANSVPRAVLQQTNSSLPSTRSSANLCITEFHYLSQAYDLTSHDLYVIKASILTPKEQGQVPAAARQGADQTQLVDNMVPCVCLPSKEHPPGAMAPEMPEVKAKLLIEDSHPSPQQTPEMQPTSGGKVGHALQSQELQSIASCFGLVATRTTLTTVREKHAKRKGSPDNIHLSKINKTWLLVTQRAGTSGTSEITKLFYAERTPRNIFNLLVSLGLPPRLSSEFELHSSVHRTISERENTLLSSVPGMKSRAVVAEKMIQ
ncbi:hypothetical protein STEG23_026019 [Scotinomys teguina]